MQIIGEAIIKYVPIKRINITDKYYSITPCRFNDEKLKKSIERSGIQVPLRLERLDWGQSRIISGFRRISAAADAGLMEVPAIIEKNIRPDITFWEVVQENYGARELDDLEKSEIVMKLKKFFSKEDNEIISRFLPGIGLKDNQYELERMLALADLRDQLKNSCSRGILASSTALEIGKWLENDQDLIINLVENLKLGINKQKLLVRLFEDLKRIRRTSAVDLWSDAGLDQYQPSELTFTLLRDRLTKIRYPSWSEHTERISMLLKELKIQSDMIQVPKYLDGDKITISFTATSPAEVRSKAEMLLTASGKKELADIFELL